jgi:NO-binding membrane sensor protein with MHYT domain
MAMVVTYEPFLVLLSIGVAIVGSLTALALTSGSYDADHDSWESSFALANGGLIMGTTIWSMHFIAMMAVQFPVLINYNIIETILSICFAIGATALGLYVVSKKRLGRLSIVGGGLAMGAGIGAMHYTGMGAIRGCALSYDPMLVGASVVVAASGSMAALWFTFYKRTILTTLVGGSVQGLAIASMHYTAMAATYFVPLSAPAQLTTPLFAQNLLALMIAGAMVLVCTGNLTLLGLMTFQRRSA